jgi:Mrp family chromosome partitioning ATPase
MVVCQNYCNRSAFSHAVEQFEFVGARILGIVMNRVSEGGRRYYRYGKRYYKNYYRYGYQTKIEND